MVVALMLTVLSVVVLVACLQNARAEGWRAPGFAALREARARRLPAAPPEDQPPPNLTPLVPSQRVIANEYERGLRELTLYLAVQRGE